MKAPLLLAAGLVALATVSAAIAQPPPTPAQQLKTIQSRHAETLKTHAALQAVDDAVKADCVTKAGDDKAKAALCPCAGAVTIQYWMDDAFMRTMVESYLKTPSPKGVSQLLQYQGPELYQLCAAK
jgi:hypothetical protein